ncbi:serine hydrolase [Candidatus Nitrosocosmicus sp. FF01]|uniref:serine hydrolase n=1 Tax=Candidatus Nitrosocosmicus sp. FF01 TaxID=3397670 RepID=UPI0039EC31CE
MSKITLTTKPGTIFLYSDYGMGLLDHLLSLKQGGISHVGPIKNRILNVLGVNDTKIILSDHKVNYMYPTGHLNGSEIETPIVPEIIAGAGALHSTADDLVKYLSANIGLLHTKLDTSIQLQHLLSHSASISNPTHYDAYVALV